MEAQLDALLGRGEFDAIAEVLDQHELETAGAQPDPEEWPYALHMLGHMVRGELENARFVWKRAPESRRANDAELKAVFGLLQSMWSRDFPGDDERSPPVSPPGLYLTAVHDAAGGAGATWSPQLAPVVQHMVNTFRAETLKLLTKAYTTVSVAHVASCLGVSEQEAARSAAGLGWQLDAASNMLTVVKPPATEQRLAALDSLQKLTEYTVHLSDTSAAGDKES